MLAVNLGFPHSYEVDEIPQLPGTGKFPFPVYYFPRIESGGRGEHDGLWATVRPSHGAPWIGVFSIGGLGQPNFFNGVVSTPDPDRLCVVAHGNAYLANAANPDEWEEVSMHPVRDIRLLPENKIMLLADFVHIAAYGKDGLIWQSPRVCWDDLKIETITAETIEGSGYDPTNIAAQQRFKVDIKTGKSLIPPPTSIEGTLVW